MVEEVRRFVASMPFAYYSTASLLPVEFSQLSAWKLPATRAVASAQERVPRSTFSVIAKVILSPPPFFDQMIR
jgi:hypothetical protein